MTQKVSLDAIPGLSAQGDALKTMELDISVLREHVAATPANSLEPGLRAAVQNVCDSWLLFTQAWTVTRREAPLTDRERRFWNRVEVRPGGHYLWTGMGRDRPDGVPICDWTSNGSKVRTTAARVAWMVERGSDIPDHTYLRRACTMSRCIAPAHHELSNDPANIGKRSVLRYNAAGQPVCTLGHVLPHTPKKGQTLYCPACYQLAKQALRTHQAATDSQYTAAKYTTPVPPRLLDPAHVSVDPPQKTMAEMQTDVMNLFETVSPSHDAGTST